MYMYMRLSCARALSCDRLTSPTHVQLDLRFAFDVCAPAS